MLPHYCKKGTYYFLKVCFKIFLFTAFVCLELSYAHLTNAVNICLDSKISLDSATTKEPPSIIWLRIPIVRWHSHSSELFIPAGKDCLVIFTFVYSTLMGHGLSFILNFYLSLWLVVKYWLVVYWFIFVYYTRLGDKDWLIVYFYLVLFTIPDWAIKIGYLFIYIYFCLLYQMGGKDWLEGYNFS